LRDHPHLSAYLALICVCILWGTTYLGIRIAVETIPPPTLMCVRYLLSGGLMLAGAAISGARLPRGRELWRTSVYGLMTIGVGTGCLAFAEQWIPSGLSALMVGASPFWLVGIEALMPKGAPLHRPTIAAMLVGVVGVALLAVPDLTATGGGSATLGGFLLLQISCAGWSIGSILQRHQVSRVHPFVSGAVQQLATGAAFLIPAVLQAPHVHWTGRGIEATLYLAIFGGLLGYSAYILMMGRLPVAIATIYTYVNPLVAVLLGSLLYHEPFGRTEAAAMVIIFLGVALVRMAQGRAGSEKSKKSDLALE
jgi:drug/metabolite transporter (DMT)-like permease